MKRNAYFYKTKNEKDYHVVWLYDIESAIQYVKDNQFAEKGTYEIWGLEHPNGKLSETITFEK